MDRAHSKRANRPKCSIPLNKNAGSSQQLQRKKKVIPNDTNKIERYNETILYL